MCPASLYVSRIYPYVTISTNCPVLTGIPENIPIDVLWRECPRSHGVTGAAAAAIDRAAIRQLVATAATAAPAPPPPRRHGKHSRVIAARFLIVHIRATRTPNLIDLLYSSTSVQQGVHVYRAQPIKSLSNLPCPNIYGANKKTMW